MLTQDHTAKIKDYFLPALEFTLFPTLFWLLRSLKLTEAGKKLRAKVTKCKFTVVDTETGK